MKKFLFPALIVVMMLLSSATTYADNVFCSPDTVYTVREIGHSDTSEFYIVNTTQDSVDFSLSYWPSFWKPEPQNGTVPPNDSLLLTVIVPALTDEGGYCTGGGNYLFRFDTSDPVDSLITLIVNDSLLPLDPPEIEILSPVGTHYYAPGDTMHVEVYASYSGCRGNGGVGVLENIITGEIVMMFDIAGGTGYYNYNYIIPDLDDSVFYLWFTIHDFGRSDEDGACCIIIWGPSHYWPWIRNINHTPFYPEPYEPCTISATITDANGIIDSATIYYDDGEGYDSLTMGNVSDSFFSALPGQPDMTTVYYYISAIDDSNNTTVSDTFSYYVEFEEEYCLSCSATTSTPRVPNENGEIIWDLYISNCGRRALQVYGEIYPTIGDCMGPQYDYNIRREITPDLQRGGSYTGYYYYRPGEVSGVTDAALSISLGVWYEFWSTNCCFEFKFTYPWGRPGDHVTIEPGIWGDADDMPIIPEVTDLLQNYPNPFNASTTISFDLAQAGNVVLSVYNLSGQKIETLIDREMQAGQHNVIWDALAFSSGIYFYKLTTDEKTFTKRMTLLK
ncbi:MAG: T9SS type A sorting domain-containing protein [candidate division Zixibacteria bacterium]|nr:T9SS type A sorting domain-containing protein [candidate division Zixibacteria bacterium]